MVPAGVLTGHGAATVVRKRRRRKPWTGVVIAAFGIAVVVPAVAAAIGVVAMTALVGIYFDRRDLPDPGPLTRFEFPTVGRIYDAQGAVLLEVAREQRSLSQYESIPPIVRDAILATEDRRFFAHDGVDYRSVPRVMRRIRTAAWFGHLRASAPDTPPRSIFPQGGSTITQQLVRGVFLPEHVLRENGAVSAAAGTKGRVLEALLGARSANMVLRKLEEMRLAVWLEERMGREFGSKERAKQEIFARYASLVYMGNGQYGFARASEYYFGVPLASLTPDDADRAALLAGIMKAPRDYAPTASDRLAVLRRRNQVLALMSARGFITPVQHDAAVLRPVVRVARPTLVPLESAAVVEHVLEELRAQDLGLDDLLLGRVQVQTTVDARIQRIAADALEKGLARYEARRVPRNGLVQGAVVVLRNSDGGVLAEVGGRRAIEGGATSYLDFNRAREAWRQPGSAMKPIVYLAAFRRRTVGLDTLVPDEPISVPDGTGGLKWIANYDGQYKGLMPARQAFAESRNAVAVWLTKRVGIDAVLATARDLGLRAPLRPFVTTALGASEVTLVDLAGAYRAMASGLVASSYVVRAVKRGDDTAAPVNAQRPPALPVDDAALALVQEALRGVVRLPSGTASALNSSTFPLAIMGKTGTTNDFRDALFVGSTYGVDGITVAVRVGFDDNRSLGSRETGGRVALPVFRDVMLGIYRDELAGAAPAFPDAMERGITRYLLRPVSPPLSPVDTSVAIKD
jgi:penicillin-binding protein 1A